MFFKTRFTVSSKITADDDCAAIKLEDTCSWKKIMTNLDSIFKSGDVTLPTKVHLVKIIVSPVVMYERESWTIKKAEHRKFDAFAL